MVKPEEAKQPCETHGCLCCGHAMSASSSHDKQYDLEHVGALLLCHGHVQDQLARDSYILGTANGSQATAHWGLTRRARLQYGSRPEVAAVLLTAHATPAFVTNLAFALVSGRARG